MLLTHRNLCANIASISEAAAYSDRDVMLSWMPLSHDMGLIGFHLNILAAGASHGIMRTELFARRPLLWLELASRMGATVLCSPNFGYQHYLKQYELKPRPQLDLSAVRLIYNGAEPISADLCRRFMQTLAAHGLRSNAMLTVYGLAEASLAVSFPRLGAPLATLHLDRARLAIGEPVRVVPSIGRPAQRVRHARPGRARHRGPDRRRGRRRLRRAGARPHRDPRRERHRRLLRRRGGAAARGRLARHRRPRPDQRRPAGGHRPRQGPGHRQRPELLSARLRARRRSRWPTSTPTGWPPPACAFRARRAKGWRCSSCIAGELEGFVAKARGIRRAIAEQTGVEVGAVVPVSQIPKTTSGKLQRYLLARAFEQGEFAAVLARLAPLLAPAERPAGDRSEPGSTLGRLEAICQRVVPDRQIGPEENLLDTNLNSLTLARLHEAIDREFPQRIEVSDLFEYPTLEQLARFLDAPSA